MFNLLLQPVLAPLMRCRMPSASLPHPASSGLQYLDASPSSLCVYQGTRGILWCKCLQDAGRADKEHLGRIANRRGKWEDRGRGLTAGICPGTELVGSRPHSSSSIGCENDRWRRHPSNSSEFIPGSLHPWPMCSRFPEPPFCTEPPPPSLPSLIGAAASRAARAP